MELTGIYNMDCMEGMKLLEDKSVDISFTSPPYNRIRNDTYTEYDDNREDYYDFLVDVTEELIRVTKRYSIINIQCNHFNKSEFYRWLGKYHDRINGIVIWNKTNPQPSNNYNPKDNTRSVTNGFEYFVFIGDGDKFRVFGEENFINSISSTVNSQHYEGHGAIMKKSVSDLMIKKFTKKGDIVLDPFMGLGTTALSCYDNGVDYIGFEISEKYYRMAIERIEKHKSQMNLFLDF